MLEYTFFSYYYFFIKEGVSVKFNILLNKQNPFICIIYLVASSKAISQISLKVKSESEVAQSCPTLCDPMDCSLPGFSIHGNFQARILEWVAISFSANYYY